jgi:hypothetical protein
VTITDYRAYYEKLPPPGGVNHSVGFQNATDKKIVAIEFGLVSFDIWNEFLDRTGGLTMQALAPQKKGFGSWEASRLADFSFHTGVAYVAKVRFESGEIWTADLDAVMAELKKVRSDFDATALKRKAEK